MLAINGNEDFMSMGGYTIPIRPGMSSQVQVEAEMYESEDSFGRLDIDTRYLP